VDSASFLISSKIQSSKDRFTVIFRILVLLGRGSSDLGIETVYFLEMVPQKLMFFVEYYPDLDI
jgi:hypothetical protein